MINTRDTASAIVINPTSKRWSFLSSGDLEELKRMARDGVKADAADHVREPDPPPIEPAFRLTVGQCLTQEGQQAIHKAAEQGHLEVTLLLRQP